MKTDELEKQIKTLQNQEYWKELVKLSGTALITALTDAGVRNVMAFALPVSPPAAHPVPNAAAETATNETNKVVNGEMAASNGQTVSDVHPNNTPQNAQQTSQVGCPNPTPQQCDLTPSATGNAQTATVIGYSQSHSRVVETSQQQCIYYDGPSN